MKRRQVIGSLAGLSVVSLFSAFGKEKPIDWHSDYLKRWDTAHTYNLAVLDAMPAEHYGFKPTPEQMSFGKHFTHLGFWNTYYFTSIVRGEPISEPENPDKESVLEYIHRTSGFCREILLGVKDRDIDVHPGIRDGAYWEDHSGRSFLQRAVMHTAHHRGEALVYMRLKGIKPPDFMF